MISLGGVTLSPSMQWTDKHAFQPVAQSVRRTLGGGVLVYAQELFKGRPITLEAQADTGWITKAMLDQLEVMAATPGGVFSLNVHGFVADVIFRHNEAPALEFAPLQPRAVPLATDFYLGTLKLLTI